MRVAGVVSRSPQPRRRVFHAGNSPPLLHLLAASRHSLRLNKVWGLPLLPALLDPTAPPLSAAIRHLLLRWRSSVLFPTPTPGTASADTSLALIAAPTTGWLQVDVGVRRLPPFRLRVPQYLDLTCPLDDTRPPWVTHVSSPPCRPHTPWCGEEEPKRLRPHSAGSTIPRLWPTGSSAGWLPLITTRWFSSSPSDLTSR
jgi:hypothetical protein